MTTADPQPTPERSTAAGAEAQRAFTQALLRDLEALEIMLERDLIEAGVNRIGAEQELAIIDRSGRPYPVNEQILEALNDPAFVPELGRFNIECNLTPIHFSADCLGRLEDQIHAHLARARAAAHRFDARIIMTGILPSLTKSDLTLANLTDRPRYHALNETLTRLRGGPYELSIDGVDDLSIQHDSVMLEAANTSFQVHFQVSPDQFARKYNIAQAIAGPVLAAACNSPILLGRRLWHETRIALFQQSIDTRKRLTDLRRFQPRVTFGTHWIESSVLEIYREDIARFKPLFPTNFDENPLELIEQGKTPRLQALCLHNGTVYRWNRACYGVNPDGTPHLRIENRILPAGPTPTDEVANAALWFGLLRGVSDAYEDITRELAFEDVHQNFIAAARFGLDAQMKWIGGMTIPARELLALKILPIAERGLAAAGIAPAHIEKYLNVIEGRVASGQTGSAWMLKSYSTLRSGENPDRAMYRLASAIAQRQLHGAPVHTWQPISPDEFDADKHHILTVGQYMTTDLFTVNENDVIDLVTNLMHWKHIRHVPVEDDQHKLVGIVSHRDLLKHATRARTRDDRRPVPVSEIMKPDPVTVTPDTTTLDAIDRMREHKLSCLPVVEDGRLVGVVTEHDFMRIAAPLLRRFLSDDTPPRSA